MVTICGSPGGTVTLLGRISNLSVNLAVLPARSLCALFGRLSKTMGGGGSNHRCEASFRRQLSVLLHGRLIRSPSGWRGCVRVGGKGAQLQALTALAERLSPLTGRTQEGNAMSHTIFAVKERTAPEFSKARGKVKGRVRLVCVVWCGACTGVVCSMKSTREDSRGAVTRMVWYGIGDSKPALPAAASELLVVPRALGAPVFTFVGSSLQANQ